MSVVGLYAVILCKKKIFLQQGELVKFHCFKTVNVFSSVFIHIIVIFLERGRVYVFGSNDWGQLGLGHKKPSNKPSFIKSKTSYDNVLQSLMLPSAVAECQRELE